MKSTQFRLTCAALTMCAAASLSGCSSNSSSTSSDSSSTAATGSSSQSGSSEGSAQTKPSKQDVLAGLEKYFTNIGSGSQNAQQIASCIIDKAYNDMSASTASALADGDPKKIDAKDSPTFAQASTSCAKDLASSIPSS